MFIAPVAYMKMPGMLMISLRDVHCLSQDVQDPRGSITKPGLLRRLPAEVQPLDLSFYIPF